jgi:hypothetical protein
MEDNPNIWKWKMNIIVLEKEDLIFFQIEDLMFWKRMT